MRGILLMLLKKNTNFNKKSRQYLKLIRINPNPPHINTHLGKILPNLGLFSLVVYQLIIKKHFKYTSNLK